MTAQLPDFEPPPRPVQSRLLALLETWFAPRFHGMENLRPERGSLFVGNHTIYGLLDVPLFQAGVYNHSGIWLRGLADHLHYAVPAWARYLESRGAIRGTRENCSLAMEQGENILVFPGGGREVMKRKGEKYELVWKERLGFVSLAVQHGYPIQPFASVGADDAYSILMDASAVQGSRWLNFVTENLGMKVRKNAEEFPPIARGLGLTVLPRPEPFFYVLGRSISTARVRGRHDDRQTLLKLRDKVAAEVRRLIGQAKGLRDAARADEALWRKLLRKF